MVKEKAIKAVSIVLIIILVIEAILLALRRINLIVFWISVAAIGIIAYKVVPKIKNV